MFFQSCLLLAFLALSAEASYYLPGVTPEAFDQGEGIKLYVNKLTSTKTQIPYEYYALPYCKPSRANLQSENLGEVLSGDRIENSVYKLEVKVPKSCEVACVRKLKKTEKEAFVRAIDDDYRVHWMVDNLPVGTFTTSNLDRESYFQRGFPVGFTTTNSNKHFLYNHIRIIIQYHDDKDFELLGVDESTTTKIVGFRVEPMSIRHTWDGMNQDKPFVPGQTVLSTCNAMNAPVHDSKSYLSVDKTADGLVAFTYDVLWEKSSIEWSQRWDVYLTANTPNEKVHWFSISNSLMIVFFLTIMIAMVLIRALRKDIATYNDPATLEEAKDESGWKLVHGDVFRAPAVHPMLFR